MQALLTKENTLLHCLLSKYNKYTSILYLEVKRPEGCVAFTKAKVTQPKYANRKLFTVTRKQLQYCSNKT